MNQSSELQRAGYELRNPNHENGRYYYHPAEDISLFEDLQEGEDRPAYYAWIGDAEAHDTAEHSPTFRTFAEADEWALGQA